MRLLPQHRLQHLAHQQAADLVGVGVRPGVHVGPDRHARRLHRHAGQGRGQRLVGRFHERRVEGAGHRQPDGAAARCLRQLLDGVAGGAGARNDDVARTEEVGDPDQARRRRACGAQFLDGRLLPGRGR